MIGNLYTATNQMLHSRTLFSQIWEQAFLIDRLDWCIAESGASQAFQVDTEKQVWCLTCAVRSRKWASFGGQYVRLGRIR